MVAQTKQTPVLHIRYDGRSCDVPLADLDVGALSSDGDVKRAVSQYLNVREKSFRNYVVDRHVTGNLTIRPEAVFG